MKDDLGDRMKSYYEARSQTYLTRRVPVIIRVDGKCFSKFCKRFEKPFDEDLHGRLNVVMKYLCENIQGCKFAERHSGEMSFLVCDYDTVHTDAYFDYNVQKICSIVASMATAKFCQLLTSDNPPDKGKPWLLKWSEDWPIFDARCFNVPESDVVNYFYWRNKDAVRNSISMHAQNYFSHKELMGVSNNEKQEMMFQKHGVNWNDLPQERKTGFVMYKKVKMDTVRPFWGLDFAPSQRYDLEQLIRDAMPSKEGNV